MNLRYASAIAVRFFGSRIQSAPPGRLSLWSWNSCSISSAGGEVLASSSTISVPLYALPVAAALPVSPTRLTPSLTWAEEASRYLFIWLIFLGAIVAYQDNVHLGVDTLVQKLSAKNKRILFIINNVILVITMGLCVDGTWKITQLTSDQVSSSMQIPMSWVYVSGFLCSVAMTVISLNNIYRLLTNKIDEKELVMSADTEDKGFIDKALGGEEGAKKS